MSGVLIQLGFDIFLDQRPEYQRAVLQWRDNGEIPLVTSTGIQQSSRLLSMSNANCLLQLPPRDEKLTKLTVGETVNALLLKHL